MYALVLIRYRLPIEEVAKVTDEHRAYLRQLKDKGIVLACGPMEPRTGGALLVRVPDANAQQSLDEIRNGDPFYKKGIANHELIAWNPMMGVDALDKL
jgi:uncharacterized protein YciI